MSTGRPFKMANRYSTKYDICEEKLLVIRSLWENSPLTAVQIAGLFNITRNVVIGYADRRGWVSFRPGSPRISKTTFNTRLNELHAKMDMLVI